MHYRILGRTGVKVSRLCFGTMSFGGDANETTSAALFKRCLDAGINFFDCANSYGRGRAEEILGRCIAGLRDELVITTKVCSPIVAATSSSIPLDFRLNVFLSLGEYERQNQVAHGHF